ncbi:MAG: hypothetical protein KC964_26565, partial [Candidatus Omnitrophica bacterium]|nr:hypothetical protein [Candidatus Omnitrophota bacterium]
MKKLLLFSAVGLLACYGAQAATINVPADQATVQAAVDAANDGDVIVLADGTYTEDVLIPGSTASNKDNITITGSAPENVIIDAPNTRMQGTEAGVIGLVGQVLGVGGFPEHKGLIVEGDGVTLSNLTIRNLSQTGDPAFGESA